MFNRLSNNIIELFYLGKTLSISEKTLINYFILDKIENNIVLNAHTGTVSSTIYIKVGKHVTCDVIFVTERAQPYRKLYPYVLSVFVLISLYD